MLTESNLRAVGRLEGVVTERGHSLLDLAMSWLIAQPLVSSVIAGATGPEQMKQNVAAAEWRLTADDLHAVDAALNEEA